ncbi:hypothetical protein DRJ22_01795 [Candidatus Woesearchaeota archaeon]|nr:MAG: hypothetical protein DRJ22_01795 [Candidatus Woesearchaeota archaeon]
MSFQDPFISNVLIYLTAFLTAFLFFLFFKKKWVFSKESFLAGLFAGVGNFFILFSLLKNLLILVLPFVSAAAIVFFFIVYFTEKPKFSFVQRIFVASGLLLAFLGLFLISIAPVGFKAFSGFKLDFSFVFFSLIIMVSFGLWTFFTYKAAKKTVDVFGYNFWQFLASFFLSIIAVLVFSVDSFSKVFSLGLLGYLYPALAGLSIFGGCFFVFKSFTAVSVLSKIQKVIVAFLANGELVPLVFLSFFILGERSFEGFLGVGIVLIGLFLLNFSENVE